ncbi:MAG: DUF4340 domain-containing protein [Verrucomicrobiota bacterium JB023]|nr:DUF4340 domain-containing protein [Verrucomicrobiota bacterium JB023]
MPSRILTLILFLATGGGVALALAHLTNQDLSGLFGKPARPVGEALVTYNPAEIREVVIDSSGRPRRYEKKLSQWVLDSVDPPDRANYRALEVLAAFPATLEVMSSFECGEKDLAEYGLKPPRARLKYYDTKSEEVVSLLVGKRSAWHKFVPDPKPEGKPQPDHQNFPSVHVAFEDEPTQVYICSSPLVDEVLRNGFGSHRDLHPFFFPPETLARVTIKRPTGTLVLGREHPSSPWQLTSPMELDTDSTALAQLIGGLFNLTALKAEDKPAPAPPDPALSITLQYFSLDGTLHDKSTTLYIDKARSADAESVTARLSDWRKNILFTLPLNAINGRPGLNDIPLTLDRLRGVSLTSLPTQFLQSLTFESPELNGPLEIFIEKSPISDEWRARRRYQGETDGASEMNFFMVKKLLAEQVVNDQEVVLGVVSDNVAELSRYGLDRPEFSLTLRLLSGQSQTIDFGTVIDDQGQPRHYFRQRDSSSVIEISSAGYYAMPYRPYQWRSAEVWDFSPIDLSLLELKRAGQPPLTLRYHDLSQSWMEARLGNEDVTPRLIENRANRLLENLQKLSATRWLGSDHLPAEAALANPRFTVQAIFVSPDEDDTGIQRSLLKLAPVAQTAANRFYYGSVSGDPDYFLLELGEVQKLAVELLDE